MTKSEWIEIEGVYYRKSLIARVHQIYEENDIDKKVWCFMVSCLVTPLWFDTKEQAEAERNRILRELGIK